MNSPVPPPIPEASSLPTSASVKPTSTAAIVSLVAGLLSWILLPWIGAVVAIIAGHMARGEIRRSNGAMDGDGLAIVGLILGYLQIILSVFFITAAILFFGGFAAIIAMIAMIS